MKPIALIFVTAFLWGLPDPASATSVPDCEAIAAEAGQRYGLPANLLPAIARMESGYSPDGTDRRAWPWALNQGGDNSYHLSKEEALTTLTALLDRGVTNVDIGCLQLNYRWHGGNFASLEHMITPEANADYAAQFLLGLYQQLGSWQAATQAYHSRTPELGQAYESQVAVIAAQLGQGGAGSYRTAAAPVVQTLGFLTPVGRPLVDIGQTVSNWIEGAPPSLPEDGSTGVAAAFNPPPPPMRGSPKPDPVQPIVVQISQTTLLQADELSPRLQRDWAKIQAFRQVLASR